MDTITQHITDLVAERDALKDELTRAQNSRFQPKVTVQASSAEEAVRLCKFLLGDHQLPVTVEIISADVAEENKRLRAELAATQARVKTLQNNILSIAGLGSVYANEED